MALIKCKECGNEVSTTAESCPSCGYSLKKEKERKNIIEGCGCLVIFIIIFAVIIALNYEESEENQIHTVEKTVPSIRRTESLFYIRIAINNDSQSNPISDDCRIWMRGYGDFYPAKDSGWKFGGALIEKAGPFDTSKIQTLYFYPDYSDESREIKVPLKFSKGNNPNTSISDIVNIDVEPKIISFEGSLLKNATGKNEMIFDRKTCKIIE